MGDLEDDMLNELLMGEDNDARSATSNEGETKFDPYESLNKELYDPVPDDACQYGKPFFWDERYMRSSQIIMRLWIVDFNYTNFGHVLSNSNEEEFDWYHPYSNFRGIIKKYSRIEFSI